MAKNDVSDPKIEAFKEYLTIAEERKPLVDEVARIKAELDAAEAKLGDDSRVRELVEVIGSDPMNLVPKRRATGKRDPNRARNVLAAAAQGMTMAELREATGEDTGYITSVLNRDNVKDHVTKEGDPFTYTFTGTVPEPVSEDTASDEQ